MAKKKADTKSYKPQDKIRHHQTMDDAAFEKVDSLKSLNAMLLKETVERRQQVDSLVHSNGFLESELNRSVMDKDSLQLQVNMLTERAVMLEIENGLVSVFLTLQVKQLAEVNGNERDGFCKERVVMEERIEGLKGDLIRVLEEKSEIEKARSDKESEIGDLNKRLDELMAEIDKERVVASGVCEERDFVRAQLDARIQEVNELKFKVIEAENSEAGILEEVTELKVNCDRLVEENTARERRIESIRTEKALMQLNLVELNGLVDGFKRTIKELSEQKKVIEDEKDTHGRKNNELNILVGELKNLVESMKIKEEALLEKVEDLEKRYVESLENDGEMRKEIDGLIEEKKEKEGLIQSLAEEKILVKKDLDDALKMLEHQELTMEKIIQERAEMEHAKIRGESDIVKMKEQLSEFKGMISSLEKSSMDQFETHKQLEVEVSHYKAAFDQTTIERNEAQERLDEEKTIRNYLSENITKMEKEMETLRKELVKMTSENGKHLKEKELENHCAGLVKDLALLETNLVETRMEVNDKMGRLGLAEAKSNRVLNMLKNTLSNCDENSDLDQENDVEEEIKDHVIELEEIKRAFKNKESRVKDLKRQLELLKTSAAEAHKGKSFWTLVSSATTLLAAAASVAYVARAH